MLARACSGTRREFVCPLSRGVESPMTGAVTRLSSALINLQAHIFRDISCYGYFFELAPNL